MQQPSPSLPYFYPGISYNTQDGGGVTTHQWGQALQEGAKPQQYQPAQWDNNGSGYQLSGNTFGPGPGANTGGQNRVPVAPQQQHPQQPSQPTPTSTPPAIHGDINKQQALMQNQQPPINFVQRQINQTYQQFPRGTMQPAQLRNMTRPTGIINYPQMQIPGAVLTQAPTHTQAILQAPAGFSVMYPTPRQNPGSFNQPLYMQPPYPHAAYQQPFFVQQQYQQPMPSGGPSPQPGTPQPAVQPMPRQMMVQPTPPALPPPKTEPKKRPNAIKIIDPTTNEEVPLEIEAAGNNNNVTPTRSNDSSARETPQPKAGVTVDNTVAAEFAARVAAAIAPELSSPSPSPTQPQPPDTPTLSDSETHHKQPTAVVPSSDRIISNTVLSSNSMEFVPKFKQAQPCEPPLMEERTPVVPTVSAETNAPAIEIQRKLEPVKPVVPAAGQSPSKINAKKQKGGDNERQDASAPISIQQPLHMEKDNAAFAKKGLKYSQKEESVMLPKERREKTRSVSIEQSPVVSPASTPDITSSHHEIQLNKAPLPPSVSMPKSQLPPPAALAPAPVEELVSTKVPAHHNGETALPETNPVHDGNKSTKHKNKKNVKMREINRKGVDKEGSDMDAFTTETIVNEDRPATPGSPPLAQTVTIAPPELSLPPSPVDKIKEDLEEKEDKLVAAKNEENSKVSALLPKEEEEPGPVPVIEKEKNEKPQPPQLTLKHSYTKDQWSPLNQAGKKKYDRDFLLELKSEPQSMVKPNGLPDVVASLMRTDVQFIPSRNSKMIMPEFARSSTSQRGVPPKRSSQQGMKRGDERGGKGGIKVIHMSLSSDQDVKLKTSENAWKPNRLDSAADKSEDGQQTEELYRNVRGILNKLTPQKFDTLIKKFVALPINSETRLQGVIKLIFEKAVDEPSFSTAYANMCKVCSKLEVSKEMEAANAEKKEEKVSLRKLLINRCQQEFESNSKAELNIAKWLEDINNCTDPEKKKELQANFAESERKIRMKSVGNIRFIGELFKLGMLTPAIMNRCIEQLLCSTDEESLECLCKLLTTIGKDLENPKSTNQSNLHHYFVKMNDLAQKKENSKVSSRVRFMLRDVIDLRNNKWVPRREDSKPKTIEQINKEAERELMEASMALNQPAPRMRQGDRQDDRKGGRGPRGSNNQSDDGWNTVGGRSHFNRITTPAFDSSKMQTMAKPDDLASMSLGGSSLFSGFGSMGAKAKQAQSQFTSANTFSVLNNQDKKSSNMRRVTPSTSMERDRERQRMIQGVSEGEGRNSRGSSMQRERLQPASQPPSRDSSQPRQPVEDNREASHSKSDDKPTRQMDEQMIDEKLERHTITIFEEYLQDLSSVEDIKLDLEQYYTGGRIVRFVENALSICLEKKPPAQNKIGGLLALLLEYNVIPVNVFVEQLRVIYEMMDDIAIDVPKVWELQAHVVVPVIAAGKLNFGHFKDACKPIERTKAVPKLLVPVLQILCKARSEGFARKIWDLSNVSIKDFMAEEGADVNAFIKEWSLGFLVGEAPKCDHLSMDQVHEKMLKLMEMNQPYEKIVEFISSNVGDKVDDLQFIRALIIAICESSITGANHNFDLAKFKQYEKLITRFVDTKEDRELAALNSVHLLLSRLQHPQGLINSIFSVFLDDNLISSESFLKWKNDREMIENKGVSILSLTSFFTALEEVETDDENS